MNIKEAKEEIKNTIRAYFHRDEFGEYVISRENQRPVYLIGPPGIGKTDIMKQIASELGVSLVSYSMTHHTRQSALGLPFIVKEEFGGKEYSISEYTMSEILAAVYRQVKDSGIPEGILFLDEINCVSETLAPAMLQFLQYKTFGTHRVPDGWIIVTAGNPPEYNDSVREFDIVTLDRLKRMDVEPDFTVWKEYAYRRNVHPAILSYLDLRPEDFYKIEAGVEGRRFVTARGWSDLSEFIRLYEELRIPLEEKTIAQYVQNPRIARDFTAYYDLFSKYRSDYRIRDILAGQDNEEIRTLAAAAPFDERLALITLILEALGEQFRAVYGEELILREYQDVLAVIRSVIQSADVPVMEELQRQIEDLRKKALRSTGNSGSAEERNASRTLLRMLEEQATDPALRTPSGREEAFGFLYDNYMAYSAETKRTAETAGQSAANAFGFLEQTFGDGQEMAVFVAELTVNYYSAHYIGRYGCEEYYRHNRELLFYERNREIIRELSSLRS